MILLAQFQVQLNDSHKFDNKIYEYQKFAGDKDPESVHTELFFPDGKMFSSSGRGGMFSGHGLWPGIGTRFINQDDIEMKKWKFHTLHLTDSQQAGIRSSCDHMKPRAYDWLGIIGQPLPFNLQLNWMSYCSEVVNEVICENVDIINKRKIRPGELVDWYIGQGLIR